jgi:hypothetical protein
LDLDLAGQSCLLFGLSLVELTSSPVKSGGLILDLLNLVGSTRVVNLLSFLVQLFLSFSCLLLLQLLILMRVRFPGSFFLSTALHLLSHSLLEC